MSTSNTPDPKHIACEYGLVDPAGSVIKKMKKFYLIYVSFLLYSFCFSVLSAESGLDEDEEFVIEDWNFNSEAEEDQVWSEDDSLIEMQDKSGFIHSDEITSIGASNLINKHQSVGITGGLEIINSEYFLRIWPELNLYLWNFSLSLGAPIRFSLYNGNNLNGKVTSFFDGFKGGSKFFRPREVDWDRPEDFLRLLRYVTYGKPGDDVFVDLSRTNPITIGHGQLVRRFAPNINVDQDNIFGTVKLDFDTFGLQAFVGPFLVPNQFGASVFFKPFFSSKNSGLFNSMQFSLNYSGDIKTPASLKWDDDQIAINSIRNFAVNEGSVHGLGASVSAELYQAKFLQIDLYGDYSYLLFSKVEDQDLKINSDSFFGGGYALGVLGRLGLGVMEYDRGGRPAKARHNLRTRIEARAFGAQFLSSYFDTLYTMQKYQFGFGNEADQSLRPTKIGYLALQKNGPWRIGYYLEASYALQGWFGVTILYEDAINWSTFKVDPASRNFSFHVESTEMGFLQFLATYQFRNFAKFSQIFGFNRANELLFFAGRMKILPFMYVNAWAQCSFRAWARVSNNDIPKALPEELGGKKYIFSNIGLQNVWSFGFDVEVVLQF